MGRSQTIARLRYARMSPRKVRLLIDLIRGMKADDALCELKVSAKTSARSVAKLLASAIANAEHNHDMIPESLVICEAYVDGGPILYRSTPRAMGRSAPIRKRTAHITIVLTGEVGKEKIKKEKNKVE